MKVYLDFELIAGTGVSPVRDLERYGGLLRLRALNVKDVDAGSPTPVVHGYRAAVLTKDGIVGMPRAYKLNIRGHIAYTAYALAYSAAQQWDVAAVLPAPADGYEYLIEAAANAAVTNVTASETGSAVLAVAADAFAGGGWGLADEVLAIAHTANTLRDMDAVGPRVLDRYRWMAEQAYRMACPGFTEPAVRTQIIRSAAHEAREKEGFGHRY